ncbi:MdtA/MuxA family multidrug efflux RND transporter periplasmic adaptor subunit [Xenorhabdus innexi]|uniref:Multidrug efflux system, subunit A n=1 Tax=Xenorhabdus innexi TaxID=290109 RepID=A0A1N6MZ20_9GAMM|nr:MdtA/MuxA family multidrug efflux RND transporter periplasmic adaptor subunit [Xenorhabdus innexi]PHM30509.1 multidrug efflux system, subunit A [Xenorhabdus innexi]SIP74067.1 Multidrug resistance protein mdtA [Xenorhabdus innexi]
MSNNRRTYFFCFAALVVIIAAAFFTWNHFKPSQKPGPQQNLSAEPPRPVQAATAKMESVPHYLEGLGTVQAADTVNVTSLVSGQLIALHFTEGQQVKKGDLLAEIDPRPYQVRLAKAQGQYVKDQAMLANAKQDLVRYQQLAKSKLISQQDLDKQHALVRQYKAALQSDQADIDEQKLQLTYSRITAPISGRVGLKRIDVGNYVSSGGDKPIVVITRVNPIDVLFSLPENDLSAILKAQQNNTPPPVIALDRNNKLQLAQGKLLSIDNQIDVATGTIKMKARFDNRDNTLFPNQFVNIQIRVNTLDNAIVIPDAALQMSSSGHFVWLVSKDNKVKKHKIITGLQNDNRVIINSGLSVGDRVVTDGIDQLTEGAMVEIVKPLQPKSDNTKDKPAQPDNKVENK